MIYSIPCTHCKNQGLDRRCAGLNPDIELIHGPRDPKNPQACKWGPRLVTPFKGEMPKRIPSYVCRNCRKQGREDDCQGQYHNLRHAPKGPHGPGACSYGLRPGDREKYGVKYINERCDLQ